MTGRCDPFDMDAVNRTQQSVLNHLSSPYPCFVVIKVQLHKDIQEPNLLVRISPEQALLLLREITFS